MIRNALALCLLAGSLLVSQTPAAPMLGGVDATLASRFGLTAAERRALAAGHEIVRTLPSASPDGIATLGAIVINARPASYLDWAAAFADFERGSSVQAVRKLSDPPTLDDFSGLVLSAGELLELDRCRPGSCTIQMDADGIKRLQGIDLTRRTASGHAADVVRGYMLDVARAYRERGLAGLPHYHDSKRATDVEANAVNLLAEEAASGCLPQPLLAYLRGYPAVSLPEGASSYLYWMTNTFGLKPTTRLSHTIVYRPRANGLAGIIATRQLYATHYFHGALDLRYIAANSESDERFVLVMVTRTRSDGLTGLSGAVMGGTVRRRAVTSLRAYLHFTRALVEQRGNL